MTAIRPAVPLPDAFVLVGESVRVEAVDLHWKRRCPRCPHVQREPLGTRVTLDSHWCVPTLEGTTFVVWPAL